MLWVEPLGQPHTLGLAPLLLWLRGGGDRGRGGGGGHVGGIVGTLGRLARSLEIGKRKGVRVSARVNPFPLSGEPDFRNH